VPCRVGMPERKLHRFLDEHASGPHVAWTELEMLPTRIDPLGGFDYQGQHGAV
jgi:hypothetical protein